LRCTVIVLLKLAVLWRIVFIWLCK